MAPAPFDPCKQWLGIDAVDLVDPRRVLGLDPSEADPLAVLRAAEARLARLRGVDPGPFAVARQALMKRVEEAREAVLQQISSGTGSAGATPRNLSMPPPPGGAVPRPAASSPVVPRVPVVPPAPPQVPPPAAAAGWPADDATPNQAPAIQIRRQVEYRKQSSGTWLLLLLIAALATAAGALYAYKFRPDLLGLEKVATRQRAEPKPETEQDPKPSPQPIPRPKPVPKPTPRPTAQPDPEPDPKPEPRPAPVPDPRPEPEPEAPPRPSEPPPPENTERLDSLLGDVKKKLQQGDFAAAQTALEEAASVAMSKPSRQRVERWAELVTFAKGFDGYREKALAAVKPGDEYDIDGKKIGIVEIDDQKFIYRFAGKNKTTPRNRIPGGILMKIVTEWFDENPANDLYIGAYHATKEEHDFEKARGSWDQAQARGADASLLLPLLEDPVLMKAEDAGLTP